MKQLFEHTASIENRYNNYIYQDFVNDRNLTPYFFILFIISPVLALISGMFTFRQKGAKFIMYLFFAVLGYNWIINPGMDSHSIIEEFNNRYLVMSFYDYLYELQLIFTLSGTDANANDPFMHVLSYTLSTITSDSRWLSMSWAIIFGYFYVKNAWLVYEERQKKWDTITIILFTFFLFWIGIIGMNAPRNYIGGMMFFFGAYSYLKTSNASYLLLVAITPFFHFMYLAIAPCFFVYVFLKDRKFIYMSVLAISFVASVGLSQIEPYLTSTELGENRTEIYTGDRYTGDRAPSSFEKETSFHAKYYRKAGSWAIRIIFFATILFGGYMKNLNHDHIQNGLAGTAIIIQSFSNFMASIPPLSGRSFLYFGLFALAYLVRYFSIRKIENNKLRWLVYLCMPAIFLFLFTQFSRSGDFTDFRVLISPFLYPFLGDDPISMKEFLRTILDL